MENKIYGSSKSSRNNDSNNSHSNFRTIFDKPLELVKNKTYVFRLDKTEKMTYNWYTISKQYKNSIWSSYRRKKREKKLINLIQ